MSRAERLIDLLQSLRRRRKPVSAAVLAEELNVSDRTIYRDVETLRRQGAVIRGEAGVGFVLDGGFLLPPMMLTPSEIDTIMLGLSFAFNHGDAAMQEAARNVAAKVRAILPEGMDAHSAQAFLISGPAATETGESDRNLALIRQAMSTERRLRLRYRDQQAMMERMVWPVTIGFMKDTNLLAAWCELRSDFRHFRTDRIEHLELTGRRFGRPPKQLLRDWREREGMSSPFDG